MSLWRKLFGRLDPAQEGAPAKRMERSSPRDPIPLPAEPHVFECRECGKVFEARRRRGVTCTECDANDVELLG